VAPRLLVSADTVPAGPADGRHGATLVLAGPAGRTGPVPPLFICRLAGGGRAEIRLS